MVVVTESGLYALIFRSRKPAAQRFRKWVTSEVLPTIRRTGSYSVTPADDLKAQLAARRISITERNNAVRMVEQIKRTYGAQAAADSLPGIYASVGVTVNLSRAVVQRELPLQQQPPANQDRKKSDAA